MSARERIKGKRGEAELCRLFDRVGVEYVREQDGRLQGADFRLEGFVALDGKRRERMRLLEWSRELEARTAEHLVPVVAYRPSRDHWRSSLPLLDLLDLLRRATA